jgi:hypothetical protein
MVTIAQKKAITKHRKRARARGLVRVEVQVSETDAALLRELADHLRANDSGAEVIRADLKAALGGHKPRTVLEMFASDLPDEYFEGVFDRARTTSNREIEL